ncbi:MAG: hypothetical protein F8N15_00935, partial [Methanobacterium sp.]|nr:hypothetical protein [Methanobacterium sp.]
MKHQDHSVSPSGGETDVGHHRRTPEATITGDDLAEALGAQAAIITGAVDRWFEHLLQRLDPGRAMITGNDTRPPGAARTAISPAPDESRSGQAVLEGQNLAQFVLSASWSGWGHHQAASITPGGVVEIHQNNSTPGVVSPTISVPEGGLFRITIGTEGADGPAVHARIVDQDNAPLGPDFPMNSGSSEVFIFAAKRTRQMKLYLLACRPHPGARFKVNEVAVDAIAVDAYYDFQKKTGERTIASLASIPARRDILFDSVFSLLPQCDLVSVFLNGYPDIPDFLHHPRIRIRRSQDWDDRGDAGKFSWIGVPDGDGYRVIADDDLIYPVDFVPSMIRVVEKHEKRAIAGAHGVLLKQPVTAYYEMDSRYVFHFESQLRQERTVHVLGTNAVCYHSSLVPMRWADFMFPNMADIFLARFAQEHGIPMVAVMRPRSWIRQNTPQGAFDTIYEHSLKRTGTGFDTSWIQDALVKAMSPLTLQPTSRPKVIQVLIASDKTGFENLAESWGFTRSLDIDWSIIAVAATDDPALLSCLANWRTDHEVHLVNTTGETPAQRMTTMIHLAGRIGGAMMVIATSGVRFAASGWTAAGLSLLKRQEAGVLLVGGSGSHRSSDALPPMACLLDPARLGRAGRLAARW